MTAAQELEIARQLKRIADALWTLANRNQTNNNDTEGEAKWHTNT